MILKYIFAIIIAEIVSVSCLRHGTLTFVIDDTFSMAHDINLVRRATDVIMNQLFDSRNARFKDLSLVTYNDPESMTKVRIRSSRRKEDVQKSLQHVIVDYGGDCPEYSLDGVRTGLHASHDNSILIVFADASPKDGYIKETINGEDRWTLNEANQRKIVEQVVNMAQLKQCQVFFLLTSGEQCNEDPKLFKPYYDIARQTKGNVFELKTLDDLKYFLDNVEFVQPFAEIKIQPTPRYTDPSSMFIEGGGDYEYGSRVVLSCNVWSYSKPNIIWTDWYNTSLSPEYKTYVRQISPYDYVNKLYIHSLKNSGTYRCHAKNIYQDVDLKVHDDPIIVYDDPEQYIHVNFGAKAKLYCNITVHRPIEILWYHDLGNTTIIGPIVNSNEYEISGDEKTLTIKEVQEDKRGTYLCYARLNDNEQKNVKKIVEINYNEPVITMEGGGEFDYDSDVVLKCKVKSQTKTDIFWKDVDGNTVVEARYTYQKLNNFYYYDNKLHLRNLKNSVTYYCNAGNQASQRVDVKIKIDPFIVIEDQEEVIYANFGDPAELHCNITSRSRMIIVWYHLNQDGKPVYKTIESDDDYEISNDGTILTINKVLEDKKGAYFCNAMLRSDTKYYKTLQKNVEIKHFAPFMDEPKHITIKEGDITTIQCGILKAYPSPKISWEFKKGGGDTYVTLSGNNKNYKISKAQQQSIGVYKCVAENDAGKNEHETTVDVAKSNTKIEFLANNKDVTEITIDYGTNLSLSCRVNSYVAPNEIIIENLRNEQVRSEIKHFGEWYQYDVSITKLKKDTVYDCTAKLIDKSLNASVQVKVNSPFEVEPTNIVTAPYGSKSEFTCGIKSSSKMKISWYRENGVEIKSSAEYVVSMDGSTLRVNNVKPELEGKYECKAYIVDDKSRQQTHETTLKISEFGPKVFIEGDRKVKYNFSVVLTCHVTANPEPKIVWKDSKGNVIKSNGVTRGKDFEFTSKWNVKNLRHAEKYTCIATNTKGSAENSYELEIDEFKEIIIEGGGEYEKGSDVVLSCVVFSYPEPIVIWEDMTGKAVPSNETYKESVNKYVRKLYISSLMTNVTYNCNAGDNVFRRVELIIKADQFIVNDEQEKVINVNYGYPAELHCNITSNYPMQIIWYRIINQGNYKPLQSDDEYDISLDGTKLTIKTVLEDKTWTYLCNATLNSNTRIFKELKRYVEIKHFVPTMDKPKHITIKEGDTRTIQCGVLRAYPSPKISWKFKKGGSDTFVTLSGNNKNYKISKAQQQSMGVYKCVAENDAGKNEHETTVDVRKSKTKIEFLANNENVTEIHIDYGTNLSLSCRVNPYIAPNPNDIIIKNQRNEQLRSEIKHFGEWYQYDVSITKLKKDTVYDCSAKITNRSLYASIDVKVKSPFKAEPPNIVTAPYGSKSEFACGIKSSSKMKISWYRENGVEIKSSAEYVVSMDGSNLTVNNVKPELEGKYECKAYIVDDKSRQQTHETTLKISEFGPKVSVEGERKVKYNSSVVLTCHVTANPDPKIVWKDSEGNIIKSNHDAKVKYFQYNSKLNMKNLRHAESYTCIATNTKGSDYNSAKLDVENPFVFDGVKAITGHYGSNVILPCGITSAFQMKISWYREGGDKIKSSDDYDVSRNGSTLTVKRVKPELEGKYVCNASIFDDGSTHATHETILSTGVFAPIIYGINGTGSYDYNSSVVLSCHVEANPKPKITWTDNKGNTFNESNTNNLSKYYYVSQFRTNSLQHNQTFNCNAVNSEGSASKDAEVNITSPFHVYGNQELTKQYGKEATITCGIRSKFNMTISWQKDGKRLNSSDVYDISGDGYNVTIKKVQPGSEGKYECEASISGASIKATHETTLTIKMEPPEIDLNITHIIGFVNESVLFECNITNGYPAPNITWFKLSKDNLTKSEITREMNNRFTIPIAQYNDTGIYMCVASNGVGSANHSIQLDVQGPPVILTTDEGIIGIVGDYSVRVPCTVVGLPTATINWTRSDLIIDLNNGKYELEGDGTLVILDPQINDTQVYKCQAYNIFSSTEKTINITVNDFIEVNNVTDNHTFFDILVNKPYNLTCEENGIPGRWFFDGNPMNVTGTLQINVKEDQLGESFHYTCRHSHKLASTSLLYIVVPGYPPYITETEPIDWGGQDGLLQCTATLVPDNRNATVEWFFNGKRSYDFVGDVKKSIHSTAWGNYTCVVSNVHGTASKHITVFSSDCLIPMYNKTTKSPLILSDDLEERKRHYYVENKKSLVFSCHSQSGWPNSFKIFPDKSDIDVQCDHEDIFTVDGKKYKLSELDCVDEVKPYLNEAGECPKMSKDTSLVEVGYQLTKPKKEFVKVYSVCYDKINKVPIYSEVELKYCSHISKADAHWIPYDGHNHYDENEACKNNDNPYCLKQLQLVDELDVQNGAPQTSTFIEGLNTVAAWHGGNITHLREILGDKYSCSYGAQHIKIKSGANKYTNINGTMVPRFLWKVVEVMGTRKSFAIVKVNDPNPTSADRICYTNCTPKIDPNDKYTYCCSSEDIDTYFLSEHA